MKELSLIVFGFILYNAQINTICTLFYKKIDLLLFTKTGFGKNVIFQLLLFMTTRPGVVLILMSLKLFQIKQRKLIN